MSGNRLVTGVIIGSIGGGLYALGAIPQSVAIGMVALYVIAGLFLLMIGGRK